MAFDLLPLYNSTFEKFVRGGFVDNVSARVPLFDWLRKSDAFEYWDGAGKYIIEPVISDTPGKVQALSPYEQINLSPVSGLQDVPFHYKELVLPIVISDREMKNNSGKQQAISLIKTKTKQAIITAADSIEEMLFGDGTGQGGKELLGLEAIMPDDNTAGSLGGFSRTTHTWIRCPVVDGSSSSVAFDNLRAKMSNIKNTCTRGTLKPDIYLTTQTVYEGYESLAYGKYTPTDKKGATDLGFDGDLIFAGKPVRFGDYVGSGRMYALSKDALKLRVEGLKSSKDSPFIIDGPYPMKPYQKATTWLIMLNGALTANMFRQLGKIKSIS